MIRSNRRVPGSSDGISLPTGPGHDLVSVTSTAWEPAWSEASKNRPIPVWTVVTPSVHPEGRDATHGTSVADGTAWAMRTRASFGSAFRRHSGRTLSG